MPKMLVDKVNCCSCCIRSYGRVRGWGAIPWSGHERLRFRYAVQWEGWGFPLRQSITAKLCGLVAIGALTVYGSIHSLWRGWGLSLWCLLLRSMFFQFTYIFLNFVLQYSLIVITFLLVQVVLVCCVKEVSKFWNCCKSKVLNMYHFFGRIVNEMELLFEFSETEFCHVITIFVAISPYNYPVCYFPPHRERSFVLFFNLLWIDNPTYNVLLCRCYWLSLGSNLKLLNIWIFVAFFSIFTRAIFYFFYFFVDQGEGKHDSGGSFIWNICWWYIYYYFIIDYFYIFIFLFIFLFSISFFSFSFFLLSHYNRNWCGNCRDITHSSAQSNIPRDISQEHSLWNSPLVWRR